MPRMATRADRISAIKITPSGYLGCSSFLSGSGSVSSGKEKQNFGKFTKAAKSEKSTKDSGLASSIASSAEREK